MFFLTAENAQTTHLAGSLRIIMHRNTEQGLKTWETFCLFLQHVLEKGHAHLYLFYEWNWQVTRIHAQLGSKTAFMLRWACAFSTIFPHFGTFFNTEANNSGNRTCKKYSRPKKRENLSTKTGQWRSCKWNCPFVVSSNHELSWTYRFYKRTSGKWNWNYVKIGFRLCISFCFSR